MTQQPEASSVRERDDLTELARLIPMDSRAKARPIVERLRAALDPVRDVEGASEALERALRDMEADAIDFDKGSANRMNDDAFCKGKAAGLRRGIWHLRRVRAALRDAAPASDEAPELRFKRQIHEALATIDTVDVFPDELASEFDWLLTAILCGLGDPDAHLRAMRNGRCTSCGSLLRADAGRQRDSGA